MAITVIVMMPRARYSHSTSTVEAGSVAEAIAPKTTPAARAAATLPETRKTISAEPAATRTNAKSPSQSKI